MKKSALICSILGLIFLSTPAYADTTSPSTSPSTATSTATSTSTSIAATSAADGSGSTPQPRDAQGREIQEPREHNDHEGHGIMLQSGSIVIGALIIAIGLAYGIGRRNSHKHDH